MMLEDMIFLLIDIDYMINNNLNTNYKLLNRLKTSIINHFMEKRYYE